MDRPDRAQRRATAHRQGGLRRRGARRDRLHGDAPAKRRLRYCSRTSPATAQARASWPTCWDRARSAMRWRSGSIRISSIAEMIAQSRTIMNRKIAPVRIPKSKAPVNEIVLRGDDIDLTKFPVAEILAGRRRPLHRHRRHHADRLARHRPHQRRLLPADAARPAPRRHVLLARQARRARPRGMVEARQALRGRGRLRHRPGAVHAGGAGVRLQGIRVRRGRRHDGPRHRIDRRRDRQPADPGARRARHRRRRARRRRAARRSARRIHRLLRPRALAAAGDRGQGAAHAGNRRSSPRR